MARNLRLRSTLLFTLLLALAMSLATFASADEWKLTGSSVRTKSVGPFTAKVYAIAHYSKGSHERSRQSVVDAQIDKKFVWSMLRDVDNGKIKNALQEAFSQNGYGDGGKIGAFVGVFKAVSADGKDVSDEIKEKTTVVIQYSAESKATTITVIPPADAHLKNTSARVEGEDFMKAVWRIWFGKIDQPSMGDQLLSKM